MKVNTIKYHRVKNNYTQEDLSKLIGISRQHVSNVEIGKNIPSLKILIRLSKVLDVKLDDLYGDFDLERG